MLKEELMQKVKKGEISLNDVREALGFTRVDHPLMDCKFTNGELLAKTGEF